MGKPVSAHGNFLSQRRGCDLEPINPAGADCRVDPLQSCWLFGSLVQFIKQIGALMTLDLWTKRGGNLNPVC